MQILITTSFDFSLYDRHLARIRQVAPGAEVVMKRMKETTEADVHAADVVFGWPKKEWAATAPRLRWIQLPWAGADGYTDYPEHILLTKASGVFGIPIAEWVIGSMLMLTRNLHLYRDQQRSAVWKEFGNAREIFGSTVGVLGLGDIGREVAKRARALGCRVIGARRSAGPAPEYVDAVMSLDELLPMADILVSTLPATDETRGLLSEERIGRMKSGAYFINVGRGATVDEQALIAALRSGHLAGAALDVFAVEPLPDDSPLWQMEQVIISPHASGRSPEANADRRMEIFGENLRRFQAGEPLINLVDRQAGY